MATVIIIRKCKPGMGICTCLGDQGRKDGEFESSWGPQKQNLNKRVEDIGQALA
jgi:hypothetical protein